MLRRLWRQLRNRLPTGLAVTATSTAVGTVTVREYTVADVQAAVPNWGTLDREAKRTRLHDLAPQRAHTTSNVVLDEWHEHIVDLLDPSQAVDAADITHFAVGDDATEPSSADTGLGNEVYRTTTDTQRDAGKDLEVSGFLDSTEANGETIRETALVTGPDVSDLTVNHALVTETPKDETKLVTIDYTLQFRNGT